MWTCACWKYPYLKNTAAAISSQKGENKKVWQTCHDQGNWKWSLKINKTLFWKKIIEWCKKKDKKIDWV